MVWMEPLLRPPPLPAALESMQHTAGSGGGGSEGGAGLGAEAGRLASAELPLFPRPGLPVLSHPAPSTSLGTLGSLGRVGAIRYPGLGQGIICLDVTSFLSLSFPICKRMNCFKDPFQF